MNGRLLLTTGHLYIPDSDKPEEAGNEYINMKGLYKQYRGSRSHGLVSVPFSCTLNLFLGGKEKILKVALTKPYSNLTVGRLTVESDALNFSALTELCMEIKVHLANSTFANKSSVKEQRIE